MGMGSLQKGPFIATKWCDFGQAYYSVGLGLGYISLYIRLASVGRLLTWYKTPTGYFSPSCGGGGGRVENRPVARGVCKKFLFWPQNWPKMVLFQQGQAQGPRKVSSKSFLVQQIHCFCGAPHPSKINQCYGPGGKTVRLAISTAVILKEEGCCRVKNSAVNRKSVERALFCFCFCFFFPVFVLFCFVLFVFVCFFVFLFVCLFVCLIDFLITWYRP